MAISPVLNVRNIEQAACMLELDGQLSDGFWENTRPMDHWKVWCRAQVVVNPSKVGRNFYADKSNYNLSAKALLDVVGLRMLGLVRIARTIGLKSAATLEHVVDCDGKIDWTNDRNKEVAILIGNEFEVSSIEVKNQIDAALANESYGMRELRADLNDLKTIFKTFAFDATGVQL